VTPVVSFRGVGKRYRRGRERTNLRAAIPGRWGRSDRGEAHWALADLSFELEPGRSLGLVGPNGAGKSTTLKLVAGVITPTAGTVEVNGRAAPLIELGAGFHPDMTGRENVYFSAAVLGMSPRSLRQRFDQIVEFADIAEYLDTPIKRYSSGMLARLGFAVASHLDVDVLVLDEVLAVGDASFQRKCHQRIAELRREGAALLYVTHALWTVPLLCEEAILLVAGKVRARGKPSDVLLEYERFQQTGSVPIVPGGGSDRIFRRVATSPATIDSGGCFEVEIELELPNARPEGHVLVVLTDPTLRMYSTASSREVATFDRPGVYIVRFRWGPLPLQPGDYQVHFGFLGDQRMPAVDEMRSIALAVRGDPIDPTWGALRIPTTWEVRSAGATAPVTAHEGRNVR